jgi:hypothetical protein
MNLAETSPIFVLGRQHSGNTMLVAVFDNVSGVMGMKGEGTFFEHWRELECIRVEERVRRLVDILAHSDAPHLSAQARRDLQSALLDYCRQGRDGADLSARTLYVRGMEYLTARRGKQRWAQKATSYIFYVDSVLQALPQAKLIYLLRNPLDLAASLKQRSYRNGLLRMVYAWNKGVRRAERFENCYPDNFRLVRYEDLVSSPEAAARKIFAFCGLEFRAEYLQVPHVNPAEAPYRLESRATGLDRSRAFRYRQILRPAEESAVQLGIDQALLARHYPELAARPSGLRLGHLPGICALAFLGAAAVAREYWQDFFSEPRQTLERLRRRLT